MKQLRVIRERKRIKYYGFTWEMDYSIKDINNHKIMIVYNVFGSNVIDNSLRLALEQEAANCHASLEVRRVNYIKVKM